VSGEASRASGGAWYRVIGYASGVACVVLVYVLLDAPSVDILGLAVPVWVVAFASYLLGAGVVWGLGRDQRPGRWR
jgi:hypothetical protein